MSRTSFNLLLGWTSVYFAFQGNINVAIISILLASFFDYLDGFAARKLNAQSELGAQLDSFADLITFGIAPAIIIYNVTTISIIFKDNIEVARFQADLSFKMMAKKEEVQEEIDNILMSDF